MVRKPSLPLLDALPARSPTVEIARRRLGGHVTPSPLDGRTVRVGDGFGVVIAATDAEAHVLVTGDVVRRVARDAAVPADGPIDEKLLCDVRVFVALAEGDRVRFAEREGAPAAEGVLFERCRFGALVAKDDGTIVAVGYRRLWPSSAASA